MPNLKVGRRDDSAACRRQRHAALYAITREADASPRLSRDNDRHFGR